MSDKTYRPCVVGVFIDEDGKVLVGRRKKFPSWQFPQGGVDAGETHAQALFREMREEVGVMQFTILEELPETLRYDFPSDLAAPIAKKYRGQEQKWFLCRLAAGATADLSVATDDEFVELKWTAPEEVIAQIIPFKLEIYQQALSKFKLLKK